MLQNEKGHALFYVLIILPILTTLSIIIFDISQWLGTRNALQAQVDRIATLASRSLPNTELAESQIREITSSLSGIKISSDDPFVISANEVRFTLQARNVALFDFLLESAGLPAIVFESKLEARVQILPGDYVIILSDSASLRPKPYEPWGNAQQWPASSYVNFSLPPLESNDKTPPDYSRALWGQDDFRRWATQQCFNPIFSPMKLAAAILADNLQKAANNRVTALFSPGAIV